MESVLFKSKKAKIRIFLDDDPTESLVTNTDDFKSFNAKYEGILSTARQTVHFAIQDDSADGLRILAAVSSLTNKAITTNALNYIRFVMQGDDAIYTHSLNVAILCNTFGKWIGMSDYDNAVLTTSGMLHDIGKTMVSPKILYKPGKLSDAEFEEIKKHTVYGYQILRDSSLPIAIKKAALLHHEKLDGKGYPFGRGADAIDMITSIVSMCDIYEAMTANRTYRDRESPFAVLEQLQKGEFGSLHAGYNMLFVEKITNSFIGNTAVLSNGEQGKIIHINKQNLSKPLVLCGDDFIDLSTNPNIDITMVL
jgi:putative nucleotidyltransferase with HDIG domain